MACNFKVFDIESMVIAGARYHIWFVHILGNRCAKSEQPLSNYLRDTMQPEIMLFDSKAMPGIENVLAIYTTQAYIVSNVNILRKESKSKWYNNPYILDIDLWL